MFIRFVSALCMTSCLIVVNAQTSCSRPGDLPGQCISLYNCPNTLALLQGQSSTIVASYLRSLQCVSDVGRFPHVCCAIPSSAKPPTSTIPETPTRINSGTGNVLPTTCPAMASEQILGDRIIGGTDAQLSEYPWTVLLEYQTRLGEKKLSCGGSLINPRYVLTAAHCLVGEIERKVGKLVAIRLGEYDITSETDCMENKCADPVISMGVEETIPHPSYSERDRHRQNDIGLVRMDGEVTYTDYIKPICLPSAANSPPSQANDILASAGWGRTLTKRQSAKKQKIYLPLYDQAQCVQQYNVAGIVVGDTQLCAGGISLQDTCDGDSGNAIMKISTRSWIVEGVVSYGRSCGVPDRPAVYTRVSAFDQWIRSNLRP